MTRAFAIESPACAAWISCAWFIAHGLMSRSALPGGACCCVGIVVIEKRGSGGGWTAPSFDP
jgi:hypothetical protein